MPALSGERFAAVAPMDGRVLAEVAACAEADVDRAVRAAYQAFEQGRWSRAHPRDRKATLLRFSQLVRERLEELALLESLDVGKPIGDALAVDVPGAARTIEWYAEAIDKLYGEVAPTARSALAMVTREPLGVVGAVVPWNYPLIIGSWKIAPALAAGNSVVLKPSEEASLSALLLARLASEAGIPDGVFNVVPGQGPVAGAALGRHQLVARIAFTGSPEVGRRFLGYAAESNGKEVSLELGGKSPQIVLADVADLDVAAEAVVWGICYNAGQTCNAGSILVTVPEVREKLLTLVAERASRLVVGDPLDPLTQMGPLVNRRQHERVCGYLKLAAEEGGRFLSPLDPRSGAIEEGGSSLYVLPTIIDGVKPSARVAQEEIFGPVLVHVAADDTDHAVAIANGTRYGLAASVWTSDLRTAHVVARELRAGTVWVNTFDASDVITPFGGFKDSGFGRDKSLHAIDAFTALKTTWISLS
ncbi:MAG TPA: aldehyde dehydrogenase family protein [Acidimicrobiales bacterium]|nr:aldehyde dehydrogenase family protein [Acidimicrobiales bacterium]